MDVILAVLVLSFIVSWADDVRKISALERENRRRAIQDEGLNESTDTHTQEF